MTPTLLYFYSLWLSIIGWSVIGLIIVIAEVNGGELWFFFVPILFCCLLAIFSLWNLI